MDKGADDSNGVRCADDPAGASGEAVKVSCVFKGIQSRISRDPHIAVAESGGGGEIRGNCKTAMGDFGVFCFDDQFGFNNAVAETDVFTGNGKRGCDLKILKTDVAA